MQQASNAAHPPNNRCTASVTGIKYTKILWRGVQCRRMFCATQVQSDTRGTRTFISMHVHQAGTNGMMYSSVACKATRQVGHRSKTASLVASDGAAPLGLGCF